MEPFSPIPETQTQTEQERLLSSVEKVFQEAPLAYKRLITFGDWLMVIDGMKAGTDIGFLGDTYDETEYQQFKTLLESNGLRVTDLKTTHGKSGIPFRQGTIYNPQALAKQTATSNLVLPFNPDEDLQSWINRCSANGKRSDAVWGKLYSFPESAIRDFSKRTNLRWVYDLLEKVSLVQRNTLHLGNESYWYFNFPDQDIIDREVRKQSFFAELESNPRFSAIYNSQELKDSDAEWSRRLPDLSKKS